MLLTGDFTNYLNRTSLSASSSWCNGDVSPTTCHWDLYQNTATRKIKQATNAMTIKRLVHVSFLFPKYVAGTKAVVMRVMKKGDDRDPDAHFTCSYLSGCAVNECNGDLSPTDFSFQQSSSNHGNYFLERGPWTARRSAILNHFDDPSKESQLPNTHMRSVNSPVATSAAPQTKLKLNQALRRTARPSLR